MEWIARKRAARLVFEIGCTVVHRVDSSISRIEACNPSLNILNIILDANLNINEAIDGVHMGLADSCENT